MPGVLMLQAVTEASAWLWRATTDFKYTVITLREVKNVKYGTFMPPGFVLELNTELLKADPRQGERPRRRPDRERPDRAHRI
jgi:3-hydroxyacyl-[acyl-carrier-protein] dehydratase